MKKILFYGLESKQLAKYQHIADKWQACLLRIGDDKLKMRVKDLFSLLESDDCNCQYFKEKYLIVDDFLRDELELFMNDIDDHMIVITRTKVNDNWSLEHLLQENLDEKNLLVEIERLNDLLKQANKLNLDMFSSNRKKLIEQELMNAYLLLYSQRYTREQICQQREKLAKIL